MNDTNNTSLQKQNKPTIGGNKFGIAKRIAAVQAGSGSTVLDYSNFPNRLGLIMDDSGSMSGSMEQCHLAIDTFIKNCNSGDTAIALYPLNKEPKNLTNIFASIGLYAATIKATGGTPLYTKLQEMLEKENISRAVAFSDGSPTDNTQLYSEDSGENSITNNHIKTCAQYIKKGVPIDTIFIGSMGDRGYKTMLDIAKDTGGIFLHFTDVSVLAKSLKYLTPHYRAMLMNAELKAKIEKGEL